jgi:hypothetical protein
MKYGNWYIPGCSIAFPTEQEALEYIEDLTTMGQWKFHVSPQFLE